MKTNAHKEYTFTEKVYADDFQRFCEKELLATKRFSDTEVSVTYSENDYEAIDFVDDEFGEIRIEMLIASVEDYVSRKPINLYRDAKRREGQLEGLKKLQSYISEVVATYRSDNDDMKLIEKLYGYTRCQSRWPFAQGLMDLSIETKAGVYEILEDFGFEEDNYFEE